MGEVGTIGGYRSSMTESTPPQKYAYRAYGPVRKRRPRKGARVFAMAAYVRLRYRL